MCSGDMFCGLRGAVLLLVLMVAPLASKVVRLRCGVSVHPGGFIRYKVEPELGPNCTQRGWEDQKRNVLIFGTDKDLTRVRDFSDWTMDLKKCLDYALFYAQCPGSYVEATCQTNCSSLSGPPPGANTTTGTQLQDQSALIALNVFIALGVPGSVLLGVAVWKWLVPKYRVWRKSQVPISPEMDLEQQPFGSGEAPPEVVVA